MNKSRFANVRDRENLLPDQWPIVKDVSGPRKRAKRESPEGKNLATGASSTFKNGGSENRHNLVGICQANEGEVGLGQQDRDGQGVLQPVDLNRGATDFSDLGTLLRKPATGILEPHRPRHILRDPVLNSVTPHPGSFPSAKQTARHDDMLGSLLGTSFATLSRDSFGAALPKVRSAEAEAQPAQELEDAAEPPFDWSLKTSLRISSSERLTCCEPGAPSSSSVQIIQNLTSNISAEADCKGKLLAALMTWRFPGTPLSAPLAATLGSSKGGEAFLRARKEAWQEALRNLYLAQRTGACDAFYVMAPEGCRKPFVAFFGASGIGGRQRQHAWLSHSSHGLRIVLEQELGLKFNLPLAPGAAASIQDAQATGAIEAELAGLGQAKQTKAPPIDGTPKSLLLFEGKNNVTGFFEYLYNTVVDPAAASVEVPLLIAPIPFLNASLQQLNMQLTAAANLPEEKAGGPVTHRCEVRGVIPPWGVDRVTHVLRESLGGEFQVTMETHPWTAAFNVGATNVKQPPLPLRCVLGGAKCEAEASRWRMSPAGLTGAVVRTLTCDGERFSARLARP